MKLAKLCENYLIETKLDFLSQRISSDKEFDLKNYKYFEIIEDLRLFYKLEYFSGLLKADKNDYKDEVYKADLKNIEDKIETIFNKYFHVLFSSLKLFLSIHDIENLSNISFAIMNFGVMLTEFPFKNEIFEIIFKDGSELRNISITRSGKKEIFEFIVKKHSEKKPETLLDIIRIGFGNFFKQVSLYGEKEPDEKILHQNEKLKDIFEDYDLMKLYDKRWNFVDINDENNIPESIKYDFFYDIVKLGSLMNYKKIFLNFAKSEEKFSDTLNKAKTTYEFIKHNLRNIEISSYQVLLLDRLINLEHNSGNIFEYVPKLMLMMKRGSIPFKIRKKDIDSLHDDSMKKQVDEAYMIYRNKFGIREKNLKNNNQE